MTLAELLADYGYLAVFVGALLEGETILLLAGFAAHQGYLSLPIVLGVAFVGGTLGDQIFFWLGRRWGNQLLARIPRAASGVRRMKALMARYHAPVIIGIRFMYGLRIVGPIVIGTARVPVWRFAFFNVIGAAIWAPLIGGLGYAFGQALGALLDDMRDIEIVALLTVAIVAAALGLWHRRRARRHVDGDVPPG